MKDFKWKDGTPPENGRYYVRYTDAVYIEGIPVMAPLIGQAHYHNGVWRIGSKTINVKQWDNI